MLERLLAKLVGFQGAFPLFDSHVGAASREHPQVGILLLPVS